jgi:hypothetical protein
VNSTVELDNLDLTKFQYFKYKPIVTSKPLFFVTKGGELISVQRKPEKPTKLQDTVNRVKAVFTYFRNLLFGNPKHKIRSDIDFPPERAEKLSSKYQQKYGKFGKNLIDFLGSGPSLEKLKKAGAI